MNINDKLIEAAASGRVNCVRRLLDLGADIHVEDDEGPDTPLQLAAMHGHSATVKLLLDRGADIHAASGFDEPEGALLHASEYGHAKTIALLLDHGADIHAADFIGNNAAIRRAAGNGHFKAVKLLLKCGADIPMFDDHVLFSAANSGSVETVSLILDCCNYRMVNPDVALVALATVGNHRELASLLNRNIDISVINLAFCRAAVKGHGLTVALLLEYGASIREDNDEAVHGAALNSHTETVAMILGRYENSALLTIKAALHERELLEAIQTEIHRRQMKALLEFYRTLPELEI